jgi:uncharacterized membrane protein YcaP (DUF421 family)
MTSLQINISFIHDPYLNIILRSLAVYFFMIIAIRVFGKKELAQLSVIDLVFILLISNAVQNAMVGPDTTLQGGLIAAASLFAANYTLKKVLYRNQKLSSLVQGDVILLIHNGKVNEENCHKAEITLSELEETVREHGASEIKDVDLAMLEVDGNISVITHDFQKKALAIHPHKHRLKGRLLKK